MLDQSLESLQHNIKKLSVIVAFKKPPSLETILKIDGFEIVDQIDDQRFHISCDYDSEALDKLVQQSSSSCWGLFEMVPEKDSLEEIFVKLTSGELNR